MASKHRTHTVLVILLLGKIMPSYFHYIEKKLVYIVIAAPSSHQPSFYIKCIKSNMCLFCNIQSVSNTKYIKGALIINLKDVMDFINKIV